MTPRAITLLDRLIATQSLSRQENNTADLLERHLCENGVTPCRLKNNVWTVSSNFDRNKPVLLLNSHHDTVRPAAGYTLDPFTPLHREGKIFGLGSNDAGASLVSLVETFLQLRDENLNINLILALTAE